MLETKLSGNNYTFVILGHLPKEQNSKSIMFNAPGAVHHAEWISVAIYSIKIFLFREEFKYTKQEENHKYVSL